MDIGLARDTVRQTTTTTRPCSSSAAGPALVALAQIPARFPLWSAHLGEIRDCAPRRQSGTSSCKTTVVELALAGRDPAMRHGAIRLATGTTNAIPAATALNTLWVGANPRGVPGSRLLANSLLRAERAPTSAARPLRGVGPLRDAGPAEGPERSGWCPTTYFGLGPAGAIVS